MAASLSSVAEDLAPIEVTNITARSLGIRVAEDRFSAIIPRGAPLPAEASKVFTHGPGQRRPYRCCCFPG